MIIRELVTALKPLMGLSTSSATVSASAKSCNMLFATSPMDVP